MEAYWEAYPPTNPMREAYKPRVYHPGMRGTPTWVYHPGYERYTYLGIYHPGYERCTLLGIYHPGMREWYTPRGIHPGM